MIKKIKSNLKISIIIISAAIACSFIFGQKTVYASPVDENLLVNLTNYERRIRGLNSLAINSKLYFAARTKAQNMLDQDYFEHYRSDGKSPWDFIHEAGYTYQTAGENLAIYFKTSEGINNAWMNSSAHRDNILRADYQDIAIAAVTGEFVGQQTTVVVEMLARPMNIVYSKFDKLFNRIQNFIIGITF